MVHIGFSSTEMLSFLLWWWVSLFEYFYTVIQQWHPHWGITGFGACEGLSPCVNPSHSLSRCECAHVSNRENECITGSPHVSTFWLLLPALPLPHQPQKTSDAINMIMYRLAWLPEKVLSWPGHEIRLFILNPSEQTITLHWHVNCAQLIGSNPLCYQGSKKGESVKRKTIQQ